MGKPGTPKVETRPDDDYYPTPRKAVEALLRRETFGKKIWEPACGEGHISEVLIGHGHTVLSTDLYDHGYGETGHDFLLTLPPDRFDAVITNPPFLLAEEFVKWSTLNVPKTALFLRLDFLEGQDRFWKIWMPIGLSRIYVFSKRVTLTPDTRSEGKKESGFIAFAWYVWDAGHEGRATIDWISPEEME